MSLVDWLIGWLFQYLAGSLVGWMVYQLLRWIVTGNDGVLFNRSVVLLSDWLFGSFVRLFARSVIGWLPDILVSILVGL